MSGSMDLDVYSNYFPLVYEQGTKQLKKKHIFSTSFVHVTRYAWNSDDLL